ncbi:MAG: HesA/MoeB/ThiF family protein [bacterium]
MERYIKHTNFAPIGIEGQKRFLNSSVLIIGAGGLGTNFASHFTRAGVGKILVVDKDKVELGNLQRQWLYDETDIGQYKAVAAVNRLRKINSEIRVDHLVDKVNSSNIDELIKDFDLVVDATDNFSTRLIIDAACSRNSKPWVFSGILGAQCQTMAVIPGKTRTLKDILNYDESSGHTSFADIEPNAQSSVLAPSVSVISSMAVIICFKLLLNDYEDVANKLFVFDTWNNKLKSLTIQ